MFQTEKTKMISEDQALTGRDRYAFDIAEHTIFSGPVSNAMEHPHKLIVGMGCFWGVERLFWQMPGVIGTAVGYAGGYTPFPTYDEVCTGNTGHTEVVVVAFDPSEVSLKSLLEKFWQEHDPTQGMRQGNDTGTQYRSALYLFNDQDKKIAEESAAQFQQSLTESGYQSITTDIALAPDFFYAEPYHQQYLDKNPGGYCGLKGTGVVCIL